MIMPNEASRGAKSMATAIADNLFKNCWDFAPSEQNINMMQIRILQNEG